MVRENIRLISLNGYLQERTILQPTTQSLFDFLFLTGTRISEALMVKKEDIDWPSFKVSIHTLKNPSSHYRPVKFFPENVPPLLDSIKHQSDTVEGAHLWDFPHRRVPQTYVWEMSKKTFGCTTHSFRHTNATLFCRAVRPNLHELMVRYGWKDPKPALIYIDYAFDESLDEKINEFYAKGGKI